MARAIPPALESEILGKAGEGLTTRAIAAWLQQAHGVTVNHTTVSRLLASGRTARADVAKTVIREKLTKTVGSDLDELARHSRRLARLIHETPDTETDRLVRLSEQHRKIVHTALHFSGAGEPDEKLSEFADAERRISGRLARLAASRGARPANP